jgi:hypothetical protein
LAGRDGEGRAGRVLTFERRSTASQGRHRRPGAHLRRQHRKFYEALTERLIAYARREFWLDEKHGDGTTTRRETIAALADQGREYVEDDEAPPPAELPEAGAYLWGWFLELSGGRASTGFSLLPISWSDLYAWTRLTGNRLEPWEVVVLRAFDGALLSGYAKSRSRGQRD